MWEGWVPSVAGCWKTAKCMVEAWCQTWNNPMQQRRRRQPPQRRHDAFTCYIDGGFKSDTKEATFGFVLYEPGGNFVKAINGKLNFCLNPLMAEALALKEALTWIKDKSVPRVQVFSDCMTLIRSISDHRFVGSSFEAVTILQCKSLMQSFSFFSCDFISRHFNFSHILASEAFGQQSCSSWDFAPFDCIPNSLN